MSEIEERLLAAGLLPAEARRKRELFGAVDAALGELGGGTNPRGALVRARPARSPRKARRRVRRPRLLCAVGRGFCVARLAAAGRPAPDRRRGPRSGRRGRRLRRRARAVGLGLDEPRAGRRVPAWSADFPELRGADVALASDLPRASGLSSSTALVAALVTVLADFNELAARREWASAIRSGEDLAGFLGDVESGRGFERARPAMLPPAHADGRRGRRRDRVRRGRTRFPVRVRPAPARADRCRSRRTGASSSPRAARHARQTGTPAGPAAATALAADEILAVWNRSTGRRGSDALRGARRPARTSPDRIRSLIRVLPSAARERRPRAADSTSSWRRRSLSFRRAADLLERGEIASLRRRRRPLPGPRREPPRRSSRRPRVALARSARELGAAAATAFGGDSAGSVWALTRHGGRRGVPAALGGAVYRRVPGGGRDLALLRHEARPGGRAAVDGPRSPAGAISRSPRRAGRRPSD